MIAQQRCHVHETREAVARCPECRKPYCRECVTEHEGRVVCAACLRELLGVRPVSRRKILKFAEAGLPIMGLLLAWLVFYGIGRTLMLIPASVHNGTAWSK